jgi:hypothetical protein
MKIHLACLLLFVLVGCSGEALTPTKIEAQSQPAANISPMPTVSPAAEAPVKPIGDYTNVKSNGEHQWGYSVELWKQADQIHGLMSGDSASILIGDPPTGILEDIVFDAATGKISFKTKLPSYVYQFEGVLTKKKLSGRLLNTTVNKTERITLPSSKEWSSLMDEYQTYAEWKVFADRILKFRGPKR